MPAAYCLSPEQPHLLAGLGVLLVGRGQLWCGQCFQPAVGCQANGIADPLVFEIVVQSGDGKATIAPELDLNTRPASFHRPHDPLEDADNTVTGMAGHGTQHRHDELIGVPIKEQQRVISSAGPRAPRDPRKCCSYYP